jgi:hypothetical protein
VSTRAELNGVVGIATSYFHDKARYAVTLPSGEVVSLKISCLVDIEAEARVSQLLTRAEAAHVRALELVPPTLDAINAADPVEIALLWPSASGDEATALHLCARMFKLLSKTGPEAVAAFGADKNASSGVHAMVDALAYHREVPEVLSMGILLLSYLMCPAFDKDAHGGVQWMESSGGCRMRTLVAASGGFDLAVLAGAKTGFDPMMQQIVQQGCLQMLCVGCFGSDGIEGFGAVQAAETRRTIAASAGVLELAVRLLAEAGDGRPHAQPLATMAAKVCMRVCMGYNEGGTARRARTFAIGYVHASVAALDVHFSNVFLEMVVSANAVIMYKLPSSSASRAADKEMDATWQDEIQARPTLAANMQKSVKNATVKKMQQSGGI